MVGRFPAVSLAVGASCIRKPWDRMARAIALALRAAVARVVADAPVRCLLGARNSRHARTLAFLVTVLATAPALAFRTAADDPAFKGTERVRWEGNEVAFSIFGDLPGQITADEL